MHLWPRIKQQLSGVSWMAKVIKPRILQPLYSHLCFLGKYLILSVTDPFVKVLKWMDGSSSTEVHPAKIGHVLVYSPCLLARGGLTPMGAPRHNLVWGPPPTWGGGVLLTKIGFQGPVL